MEIQRTRSLAPKLGNGKERHRIGLFNKMYTLLTRRKAPRWFINCFHSDQQQANCQPLIAIPGQTSLRFEAGGISRTVPVSSLLHCLSHNPLHFMVDGEDATQSAHSCPCFPTQLNRSNRLLGSVYTLQVMPTVFLLPLAPLLHTVTLPAVAWDNYTPNKLVSYLHVEHIYGLRNVRQFQWVYSEYHLVGYHLGYVACIGHFGIRTHLKSVIVFNYKHILVCHLRLYIFSTGALLGIHLSKFTPL